MLWQGRTWSQRRGMMCDSGASYGGSTAGEHEVSVIYGTAVNTESMLGVELTEGGHMHIAVRHIRPPDSAMGLLHQGLSIRLRLPLTTVLHWILVSTSICVVLIFLEFVSFSCISQYYYVNSQNFFASFLHIPHYYYVNSHVSLAPFQLCFPHLKTPRTSLTIGIVFLSSINAASIGNHE